MGLDIYLHRCADRETAKQAEEAYSAYTDSLWSATSQEYKDIPESTKEEIRAKSETRAAELGIKDYDHESVEKIELDSKFYPEHMFKIGYFRSSYNGGGIERVLGNLGLPTLHDILGYAGEYEFAPDWAAALERCKDAVLRYSAELEISGGELRVMRSEMNMFTSRHEFPQSEEQALTVFKKEKERGSSFGDGYGNINGDFFFKEGLRVLAVIPGISRILREQPCTYLIIRNEGAAEENWYLQALKIVQETIEYVLAQKDPQHFYFHWSS